jgi:hypothetical protein
MLNRIGTLLVLGLLALVPSAGTAHAETSIAVSTFSYVDTSGEPTDLSAEHAKRLTEMARTVRRFLDEDPRYAAIIAPDPTCGQNDTECMRMWAKTSGADLILIGGLQKVSTLITQLSIAVFDTRTGKRVFSRDMTFRGDNDEAWTRAARFIAQRVLAEPLT